MIPESIARRDPAPVPLSLNEQGNLLGLIKKETEPWRDGAPLPKGFSLHSSVPLC